MATYMRSSLDTSPIEQPIPLGTQISFTTETYSKDGQYWYYERSYEALNGHYVFGEMGNISNFPDGYGDLGDYWYDAYEFMIGFPYRGTEEADIEIGRRHCYYKYIDKRGNEETTETDKIYKTLSGTGGFKYKGKTVKVRADGDSFFGGHIISASGSVYVNHNCYGLEPVVCPVGNEHFEYAAWTVLYGTPTEPKEILVPVQWNPKYRKDPYQTQFSINVLK